MTRARLHAIVGERNWWLPAWLDRILPNVDIEGGTLMTRLDNTEPQGSEPTGRELATATV